MKKFVRLFSTCLVPLADGCEPLEAITIIDILRRAQVNVKTASLMQSKQIKSRFDIYIEADYFLTDIHTPNFDMIALPGGVKGAENIRDHTLMTDLLQQQHQQKKYIAAICASPSIVLAHHGIIGSRATCYPSLNENLKKLGIQQESLDQQVVVDQHIITSQGPATSFIFSLKLVEILKGKEVAKEIANQMLFDYKQ